MEFDRKRDQLLVLCGLCWAALVTVLRAVRWPNDWAEAHWLISYEFGFVKRGVLGTLIAPFVGAADEYAGVVIKAASTAFFLLFFVLLLGVCVRVVRKSGFDLASIFVVLVFLTSPYLVMSAHLNGYFDNVAVILALLGCWFVKRGWIGLSAIVLSVAVLVHETSLLVGLPSVLFFALVQHTQHAEYFSLRKFLRGFLSRYTLLIVLPLFAFLCITVNQALFLERDWINGQLVAHLSRFDIIENNRDVMVADALTTSFLDHFIQQSPYFFLRISAPIYLVNIGLPLLVLFGYSWRSLQRADAHWVVLLALALIILLPLSLHFIAVDLNRIWTYPLVVAMLGLWAIWEGGADSRADRFSILFCVVALAVIVFQLFNRTPLMDGVQERFTAGTRVVLYAPSVVLIGAFMWRLMGTKPHLGSGGTDRLEEDGWR